MINQITLACYTQGHENQFINQDTWFISELYWSFLKEYDTKKVEKCNINIRDNWGDLIDYYENYTDVITIRKHFDFENYKVLSKQNKKEALLEILHTGMLDIAKKEKWEIEPLQTAYNNCLKAKLEYKFNVSNPKSSPNKKHKINFWCNWDIDTFEVYWVLYNKNGVEIKKEKFIQKPSYKGQFIYYIKSKWVSNNKIIVEDKFKYNENEKWEINLDLEVVSLKSNT